jgi:hypothetical protein
LLPCDGGGKISTCAKVTGFNDTRPVLDGWRSLFVAGKPTFIIPGKHFQCPYVLPSDLPNAMKRLTDPELDPLVAAALAEQRRRGRKPSALDERPRRRRFEEVPLSLTSGKLNAVRAAFKAGITPSRIARQFGISQSDVRKALAADASRRK